MNRETIFSGCRKYRYTLWREWGVGTLPMLELGNRKSPEAYCMFIGLNPSTADETNDDPTIRRCIDFAKRWGYGALCMTNIFAWRDTDPEKMKRELEPIGLYNDEWLTKVAAGAGVIVAAWGKHGAHMNRAEQVKKLIPNLQCLKLNGDGSPQHPLYLKATLTPFPLQ